MKILSILLLAILTLTPGSRALAQGQDAISLSISPPHSEIMVMPGKNIVQAFNIQNNGSLDLNVTAILVDFAADPETGGQHLLDNSSFPYAQLQNLDKTFNTPFLLKSGQKDQLVIKFTIPEDAEERDYYQTLLLKTAPAQSIQSEANTSQALGNIGINILIRISADGIDRGELMVERVDIPKIVDVFSPINMQIFVKNVGENYTKIEGEVRVVSAITKKIEKVFPMLQENVLAESVREAHAAKPDPDEEKSATAGQFVYDPLFIIGPYSIEVTLNNHNSNAQTLYGRVWALPISPLLVLAAFLAIRAFLKKLNTAKRSNHTTS